MSDRTCCRFKARAASIAGAALIAAGVLGGCSVIDRSSAPAFSKDDTWTVLPLANTTETPQAGQRAAVIAQSLMASYGYANLTRYPASGDDETLFDPARPDQQQSALTWAKQQNAHYALTGAVNEWRYKGGVDGEPAVGLTFDVVDLQSGKIVWSTSGARTGWSRAAVSGVAQQQKFYALTGDLPVRRSAWADPALVNDEYVRAFREQLEMVKPTPKVPEWERIANEMQLMADRVVRGGQPVDDALRSMDAATDAILAKRRALLEQSAPR